MDRLDQQLEFIREISIFVIESVNCIQGTSGVP